jgi:hypothetical protein
MTVMENGKLTDDRAYNWRGMEPVEENPMVEPVEEDEEYVNCWCYLCDRYGWHNSAWALWEQFVRGEIG